jgi:hypothetical protein
MAVSSGGDKRPKTKTNKGVEAFSPGGKNPELIDNTLSWEKNKPPFSCQIVVKNNGLIISTRPRVKCYLNFIKTTCRNI